MRMSEPTGNTRLRIQRVKSGWFSSKDVLVFQLEMKYTIKHQNSWGMTHTEYSYVWEDANTVNFDFKLT